MEGSTPSVIVDRRTPGTETNATPPWLVSNDDDPDGKRGRGRSTTWWPSERRRRKQTESVSCHVSTRHRTWTPRSRRTSSKSSTSEQMLIRSDARRPTGADRQTSTSVRGLEQLTQRRLDRDVLTTSFWLI